MSALSLLYQERVAINNHIGVVIPKVGQVIDNEEDYYGLVSLLTAMPIDLMVQLDDVGVDFTTIDEYELFVLLFSGIKTHDTRLVFGDLDLSKFKIAVNEENQEIVLIDDENDIKIDRAIHDQIANTLRKIHHIEKDNRKPANDEAKEYMIERARVKLNRRRRKGKEVSQLEQLIVAMVNTEQFKYDFEGIRELSIYQFNESVQQVISKVNYDNRMIGVYTGNIDYKELSQDETNWLVHK